MDFHLNLDSELVSAANPAQPISVKPDTPVRDVLALMKAQATGSVLICRGDQLVGIFTERDAVGLIAQGSDLNAPIERVMTSEPVTIQDDATVGAAIRRMAEGGYRRLPILDEAGSPRAVLKSSNIVRYLVEHCPETVYNLPPQPDPVMHQREGA